jgi:predicted transcriptional regulator
MTITKDELECFGRFAAEELDRGNVASLEQLVTLWRRAREREDVNAAIRQGLEEADAGRGRPLDEFLNEFCERNEVSPDA